MYNRLAILPINANFAIQECGVISEHNYVRRHRNYIQKGRKIGCPATAVVKELQRYAVTIRPVYV